MIHAAVNDCLKLFTNCNNVALLYYCFGPSWQLETGRVLCWFHTAAASSLFASPSLSRIEELIFFSLSQTRLRTHKIWLREGREREKVERWFFVSSHLFLSHFIGMLNKMKIKLTQSTGYQSWFDRLDYAESSAKMKWKSKHNQLFCRLPPSVSSGLDINAYFDVTGQSDLRHWLERICVCAQMFSPSSIPLTCVCIFVLGLVMMLPFMAFFCFFFVERKMAQLCIGISCSYDGRMKVTLKCSLCCWTRPKNSFSSLCINHSEYDRKERDDNSAAKFVPLFHFSNTVETKSCFVLVFPHATMLAIGWRNPIVGGASMLLRHRRGFLSKHKGEGEKAYIPYRALVQTCSVADELSSASLLDSSNF